MSGLGEVIEESTDPSSFISVNILIVIIAASILGIVIIVLTTILVGLCIYYCRKKRKANQTIHSQAAPLKVSIPVTEASRFFVVETSHDSPDMISRRSNGRKERQLPALQFPTLIFSSLKRKNVQPELQVISKPIILDMESNPNYHKLATSENGGSDTPESSSSPILIVTSEHNDSENTPTATYNEVSIKIETSDRNDNHAAQTPDSLSNNKNSLFPVPPARHESLVNSYSKPLPVPQYTKFLPRAQSDNQIGRQNDYDLYGPIYSELSNRLSTSVVKIKVIARGNVRLIKNLGMGQFGLVHLGETVGLSQKELEIGDSEDRSKTFEVAVKVLRPKPPQSEKLAFEREVKYMSHFKHRNVVRLLAVCWEDQPFILMEYMRHGDLQNFLQQYDVVDNEISNRAISHSKLVQMATQISDAMMYLASRKFIHRDLATRNCLVGDDSVVKVADFGLSRNLYDSCYYRFQGSAMLPIRWMANECFYGRFSEKTDVWAFGVTMWEIFTLCKEKPYCNKTDQQLVVEILRNTRTMLEKPKFCDEKVYSVMKQCMRIEAKDRLNFEQVFHKLSNIQ